MVAKPLPTPPSGSDAGTGTDAVARAQALLPRIAAAADEIDKERRVPAPLLDALLDAGLFRLFVPRAYGGSESDPLTFMRILEAIAGVEAGTAWNLGQNIVCGLSAGYMPPQTARTIFSDPRAILAWGPPAGGLPRAVAVDGGYRVTGTWSFASGMRHATWLGGIAALHDMDGKPRLGPDGKPIMHTMLFPYAQATVTDIWDVLGLRGTASDQFAVTDLFVPKDQTTSRDDPAERREQGRLYNFATVSLFAPGFASVALGIARAMLDAFKQLAQEKTPRGQTSTLRDNAETQSDVGQAEGKLRSARAFLFDTMRDAWESMPPGGAATLEQRVTIRLAASHAILSARQVADLAYDAAGATAIFGSNPFEKRFRDMHTLCQQIQGRKANFQSVGRFFLGLEPDNPFL